MLCFPLPRKGDARSGGSPKIGSLLLDGVSKWEEASCFGGPLSQSSQMLHFKWPRQLRGWSGPLGPTRVGSSKPLFKFHPRDVYLDFLLTRAKGSSCDTRTQSQPNPPWIGTISVAILDPRLAFSEVRCAHEMRQAWSCRSHESVNPSVERFATLQAALWS